MNRYFILTKTFISAIRMSKPQDKKRKIMILFLSLFAILGVLLPVTIGVGVLVKLMTDTLIPIGYETLGIQLMFHIICIFTIVFGMNVIFNEFYFSNDIEYLLPWPLHAYQIIASKFTAAFYNENIMQFSLVLSCIIGYGISTKMGLFHWILSIIGIITLPILPLAYCAILSILIMAFTKWIHNKDIIQKLSVSFIFILIIILISSIGFLQNMDIDHYVESLANGKQTSFKIMNYIFPNVPLFVKTFTKGSISSLLGYIAVHVFILIILLALSECLYFKGIIKLNASNSNKKNKQLCSLLKKCKQKNPAYAYFLKEVRMLIRTPVFFTNCILINFLWPIFIYAMYKIQSHKFQIAELRRLYANKDQRIQLALLLGIVGISILVASVNSLSSNAISREGKHFSFIKYIPIPYFTQWNVKVFIGIIFPALGIFVYMIPFCYIIQVPPLDTTIFCMLSLLSISFVSHMGVYIDSIQPKLIWDDEMSALRENYNTFFAMAISIAFSLIICLGGFFLFCNTKISILFVAFLLFLILVVSNLFIVCITKKTGIRNIQEQEET